MSSVQRQKFSLWYVIQSAGSLLWILQAGVIAWLVSRFQTSFTMDDALLAGGSILLLGLIKIGLENWAGRHLYLLARQMLSTLRHETADILSRRSPFDKTRPASGFAASVLTEQAEAIVPWLVRYQAAQSKVVIIPCVILIVVAYFSWVAALILLFAAPLIPFFMAIVGWSAKAASEQQMIELGNMNGFLLDRLRGLSTLRAFHAVSTTVKQLKAANQALKNKTMKVLRIAFLSSAVLELFSALGVALVAVYVGFHLLGQIPFGAWGQKLSLAQGLFILLLAPAFFEPLRELSAAWHDRANGLAAIDNITQLQKQSSELISASSLPVAPINNFTPDIRFDQVSYQTDQSNPILQHVSFAIAPGEHIALTGPSGAGKSIALGLIAGLITPTEGHVHISGAAMTADNAAYLRQQMAWMGQHPHIFTGSAERNINLYRTALSTEQRLAMQQQTDLDTVLGRFPQRILGEGGVGLSGGEALRLAFIRFAANTNASILLLDEPTAHLDHTAALKMLQTIKTFAQNKTLIVATHDPEFIAAMDRSITIAPARGEA